MTKILKEQGGESSFQFGSAGESGIVSYTSDGLENLDMNTITAKTFENTSDDPKQLRKTESVKAGSPIYRLVTNESWSVVFPLSKEQFKNIQQEKTVTVTLKKIQAKVMHNLTKEYHITTVHLKWFKRIVIIAAAFYIIFTILGSFLFPLFHRSEEGEEDTNQSETPDQTK